MKWFVLFAFGALCGLTNGDTQCFREKSLECNRQLQNELLFDFSFCSLQKRVIGCLTKPAVECNLKFKSLAEKVNSIVTEVCKDGSKLHEEMDKNKDCIMKGITDMECLEPVMNILGNGNSPKEILKVQKETCRHLDQMTSCTVEKVRKACGKGVDFFRSLYDPAIELHQKFCEELILTENEATFTTQRSEKTALPAFFGPLEFII